MNEPVSDAPATHRVLAALAAGAVLVMLVPAWHSVDDASAIWGGVFGVLFLVPLAGLATVASSDRPRTLRRLDLVMLGVALVAVAAPDRAAWLGRERYRVDEAALVDRATTALAHGLDPYRYSWPAVVRQTPTLLFDGRVATRFGYPPLVPELGAAVRHVLPVVSPTAFVCLAAVLISTVSMFVLLPSALRPVAIIVALVASVLPGLAAQSLPMSVAVMFLIVAAAGWSGIGRSGRLGRRGVVAAVSLGLAASAQQLVWFVVPFLLVALWRLRRGDLGPRAGDRLAARFGAVAAAPFVLVNAPFVISAPGPWWDGITAPLRQHALPAGPGPVELVGRVLGGSGAMQYFSWAAVALFASLLAATALYPARFAPAALVLPVMVFWLSVRSEVGYYEAFVPAVVVAIATVRPADFAAAEAPALSRWSARRNGRLRLTVIAAGAAATAACLAVALTTAPPLTGRVGVTRSAGGRLVRSLTVTLVNRSANTVAANFVTGRGAKVSRFWNVGDGSAILRPGARRRLVLYPPTGQTADWRRTRRLLVVSDDPPTITVLRVPREGQASARKAEGRSAGASASARTVSSMP